MVRREQEAGGRWIVDGGGEHGLEGGCVALMALVGGGHAEPGGRGAVFGRGAGGGDGCVKAFSMGARMGLVKQS